MRTWTLLALAGLVLQGQDASPPPNGGSGQGEETELTPRQLQIVKENIELLTHTDPQIRDAARKALAEFGAKVKPLLVERLRQLKALEPSALRGRSYPLSDEVTLGRAAGCQVPLDDAYASQVHARVFQRDGQWYVEDLGSTNGTYLNRRRVAGPMVISRRDKLQIGNTVLEMQ